MSSPTLHLMSWSWRDPSRPAYTIMARPREWEHGLGRVGALVPDVADLEALRSKQIDGAEFERRCTARFSSQDLRPGLLLATTPAGAVLVKDGDVLCCACAVGRPCHRRLAAPLLRSAGWDVWLDGVRWTGPQPRLF